MRKCAPNYVDRGGGRPTRYVIAAAAKYSTWVLKWLARKSQKGEIRYSRCAFLADHARIPNSTERIIIALVNRMHAMANSMRDIFYNN